MTLLIRSFSSASTAEINRGLLAWLCLEIDRSRVLDGITLRLTQAGNLTLSFPERCDSNGRRHPYIHPLNDQARRDIERKVFEALRSRLAP